METSVLVKKIAMRLEGSHKDQLTIVERQIANLLVSEGYLTHDAHGNLIAKSVERRIVEKAHFPLGTW